MLTTLAFLAASLTPAAATGPAGAAAAVPMTAEAFVAQAERWLLNGRDLPPDYRQHLMQMSPTDRIEALIFLRRSGLLTGPAWPITEILGPEPATTGEK